MPASLPPGIHEQSSADSGKGSLSRMLHLPEAGHPEYTPVKARGAVHALRYDSRVHGRRRECWLYTPPGYDDPAQSRTRYPLLVLQHAGADTHQTWVSHGNVDWLLDELIDAGRAVPMVVLMLDNHPGGEPLYFDPATRPSATADLARELLEEALPLVESRYRIDPSRDHRGVAAPSVGGGQLLGIGLDNLDRFAWIGVFSFGYAEPGLVEPSLADPETLNARLLLLWIACASGDEQYANNLAFVARLAASGIRHEWRSTPGAHAWPVWRRDLTDFLGRVFRTEGA